MIDRILLILLLLLLPIGIIASKVMSGDIQVGTHSTGNDKKIETLINNLSQQISAPKPQTAITVTAVINSTQSGQLQIGLMLPASNKSLWVTVAGQKKLIPTKKEKIASPSASPSYTFSSMIVPSNNTPSVTFSVPISEYSGIVEIHVVQESNAIDVRYDVDKNKKI